MLLKKIALVYCAAGSTGGAVTRAFAKEGATAFASGRTKEKIEKLVNEINDAVRQLPGVKWSQTHKQWHLPAQKNSVVALRQKINSLAELDSGLLKRQLEERNRQPLANLKLLCIKQTDLAK